MQIEKINELPAIPMLRTSVSRDLQIAGHTVRIHKLRARQAAIVAQRLMESFGETLLRFYATPGDELKKVFEGETEVDNWQMFKLVLASGFLEKAIARLREIGHDVGPDHIAWYFDNVLAGNVELQGYRFKSLEEMDESGFGMAEIFECFGAAIELAIYPTSDDPGTDAGKSETKSEPTPRQQRGSGKKAPRGSRPNGATKKGGQSVQMSSQRG